MRQRDPVWAVTLGRAVLLAVLATLLFPGFLLGTVIGGLIPRGEVDLAVIDDSRHSENIAWKVAATERIVGADRILRIAGQDSGAEADLRYADNTRSGRRQFAVRLLEWLGERAAAARSQARKLRVASP